MSSAFLVVNVFVVTYRGGGRHIVISRFIAFIFIVLYAFFLFIRLQVTKLYIRQKYSPILLFLLFSSNILSVCRLRNLIRYLSTCMLSILPYGSNNSIILRPSFGAIILFDKIIMIL